MARQDTGAVKDEEKDEGWLKRTIRTFFVPSPISAKIKLTRFTRSVSVSGSPGRIRTYNPPVNREGGLV